MNRGPKPKPTVIHVANDNPGKRDITDRIEFEKSIPIFNSSEELDIPDWIKNDKIAKEEWERVTPILVDLGLLKKNDTSKITFQKIKKSQDEKL